MKGRIRRGILTAAAVLAVSAGFLLWVCWDEAVYPLKNHLARQEWQRIVDTVPETAAVTFTDGTPGGDVPAERFTARGNIRQSVAFVSLSVARNAGLADFLDG